MARTSAGRHSARHVAGAYGAQGRAARSAGLHAARARPNDRAHGDSDLGLALGAPGACPGGQRHQRLCAGRHVGSACTRLGGGYQSRSADRRAVPRHRALRRPARPVLSPPRRGQFERAPRPADPGTLTAIANRLEPALGLESRPMPDPAHASPSTGTTHESHSSLLQAAGVVGVATFSSRILGFVRDMVLARLFGATPAADAFFVAFRIPSLLRELFAEGSMSAAFIPVYTEYRTLRG